MPGSTSQISTSAARPRWGPAIAAPLAFLLLGLHLAHGEPTGAPAAAPPPPADQLERLVFSTFTSHCAGCHQTDRLENRLLPEGGLGNILMLGELARDPSLVTPGAPDASRLYQVLLARHAAGAVFLDPKVLAGPSSEDIGAVRDWIAGLPRELCAGRQQVTSEAAARAIETSVEKAGTRARFLRFVSLRHIYNACASDADMKGYRAAVAKLINSLSWRGALVLPQSIDASGSILAIDLDALGWTAGHWSRLSRAAREVVAPGGVGQTLPAGLRDRLESDRPIVPGDWLAYAALRAPLYGGLIGWPAELGAFAELRGVDIADDIKSNTAARAGLMASAVTGGPRIIEHHAAENGSLWLSLDFAGRDGLRDIQRHPLGPEADGTAIVPFKPDQVRLISGLPNGLVAFGLFDEEGHATDLPGLAVGAAAKRYPGVRPAADCMSCHSRGPLPASDELRPLAETPAFKANAAIRDRILALYPKPEEMARLVAADQQRYAAALAELGLLPGPSLAGLEPITALARAYTRPVERRRALAELDLDIAGLVSRSAELGLAARALSQQLAGGSLSRKDAERLYRALDGRSPAGVTDAPSVAPKLRLWSERARYKRGDLITVFAKSSQDCHLTLVSVAVNGRATVIAPNDLERENRLPAHTVRRVPGQGADYQLRASEKGREIIAGLCTPYAATPSGIDHDFQHQRFTVLGDWRAFLMLAFSEDTETRRDPVHAERTRVRRTAEGQAVPPADPVGRLAGELRAALVIDIE